MTLRVQKLFGCVLKSRGPKNVWFPLCLLFKPSNKGTLKTRPLIAYLANRMGTEHWLGSGAIALGKREATRTSVHR